MKEDKFLQKNSKIWSDLEFLLTRLTSRRIRKIEGHELSRLLELYNLACGHLSYSRTYYGNTGTTAYLNKLVDKAHTYIYTTKTSTLRNLGRFFGLEFPRLLRQNRGFLFASTAVFILGFMISFIYTWISSENATAFIPKQLLDSVNFQGSNSNPFSGSVMSSFIFTNNIKVGFSAFALGITLGIGTVYSLLFNSFMLGGLAAMAEHSNESLSFWSLILPHGVLELFAIFVCGAAGLLIAMSIIKPGIYSRKDAIILRGRSAIKLVCGTIPIFIVAGLIEGFITPSGLSPWFKLAFAGFTFVVLLLYLILPNVFRGKEKNPLPS